MSGAIIRTRAPPKLSSPTKRMALEIIAWTESILVTLYDGQTIDEDLGVATREEKEDREKATT